ncbi:jg26349, partial [Pararge aegeria aegeria]
IKPTDDIDVYNCSMSHMKTLTMKEISVYGKKILREVPIEGMLWSVGGAQTLSRLEYCTKVLLLHLLPAILVDLVLWISGNKPMLLKLHRRIYTANIALEYFSTQQWKFTNQNIIDLRGKIKAEDQNHFFYVMETINPLEFFKNACIGAKEFILKESMENLTKAKAHFRRMELLDKIVKTAMQTYALWFIINGQNCLVLGYSVKNSQYQPKVRNVAVSTPAPHRESLFADFFFVRILKRFVLPPANPYWSNDNSEPQGTWDTDRMHSYHPTNIINAKVCENRCMDGWIDGCLLCLNATKNEPI